MSVGNWLSYSLNALQAVAIVVGGFFAYYKFVKGRTFHRRAELSVDAELIHGSEPKAVRAHVELEDTGASDIPLRLKTLGVSAYEGQEDQFGNPVWREIAKYVPLFTAHTLIESQETIEEDVLIPLPPSSTALAYRVTGEVYEDRRGNHFGPKTGATVWTGNSIVPVTITKAN